MGVQASLWQAGRQLIGLPDPAGGTFDAAGDFDRVLGREESSFPLLSRVDPYGDVQFMPFDMPQLLSEIERLLPSARQEPERRGLERLRILAEVCATMTDASIAFVGD
ncbi:hypothetical protein GA0070622_1842 [Micromonospora sediminicola]|uniref:Uncharacterized protein n=2 Tax=Micromonosporaceae TaxID=28056 RepID=A0A1A9B787_9ACTN|nr:hypothetical protein COO58_21795 [Micromonospora sp. WMMA1996]SBT64859.1 hypothetical protein GA0070622_1842 [Micromonospora sediminicola]